MDIYKLLPIGSIVALNETDSLLMIFGIRQIDPDTQREYDYIGVPYPEGNIGAGGQFLFDQSDISRIVFRGFENPDRIAFLDKLYEFYQSQK